MSSAEHKEVRVQGQGRVVIPAELRQAMNLHEGERLIARVDDGRLILERRADVRRRLMALFVAESASPVDELIRERREAAASE